MNQLYKKELEGHLNSRITNFELLDCVCEVVDDLILDGVIEEKLRGYIYMKLQEEISCKHLNLLKEEIEEETLIKDATSKIQEKVNKMIEDGVLFGPNMITFAEELKTENETITIYRKNQVKLVDKIKALEKELEDYKNIHISIDFTDKEQNAVLIHQLSGKYMYQMFGKRFPKNSEVIISLDDLIKQRKNGR